MKIFKFGGASVKDAESVKNVFNILHTNKNRPIVVVISAMGKTTNALETVIESYLNKNEESIAQKINQIKQYHLEITRNLFDIKTLQEINTIINDLFEELNIFMTHNKSNDANFVYSQIIGLGELLSTKIIHAYLKFKQLENTWIDVREIIKTSSNAFREAEIDLETTSYLVKKILSNKKFVITQGFIASNKIGLTTTLGREGSDYTAGILAYCLNAESLAIWKDVAGVLNADPRYFEDTALLSEISYQEAIELAFYGASVIHPKTIQPIQNKNIPLYIKSFLNPTKSGTAVSNKKKLVPHIPCFIVKKNLALISLSTRNFSFINERNISSLFNYLNEFQITINVIQNSAVSFSICVRDPFNNFDNLITVLQKDFKLSYQKNVTLYTIRHSTKEAVKKIADKKCVLLKQQLGDTIQIAIRDTE